MASATGATDPNGWLTPGTHPGSVIVKIVNTSRDTMNGKMAAVLAYQEDKGRYVVHTTSDQTQASLKPENLVKAGWIEGMKAQFEMIQNHPEVRQKIGQAYHTVQQKTGMKPEYVAAAALVVLVAAMYYLGFTKTLTIVSFGMLVLTVVAPDLGSPVAVMARNFPMRARAIIREQIPVVGPRIADNQYLSMAFVGLVLFFFVTTMLKSPVRKMAAPSSSSWTAPSPAAPVPNRALLQDYYQKGFEDGKAGLDFGTSLPVPVTAEETDTEYISRDLDYDYVPPPPPTAKKSGFDWTIIMSLMYLGRQVFSMGSTADGGWDAQLALANLRTMDTMRMGFMAFSVYRLVSALSKSF